MAGMCRAGELRRVPHNLAVAAMSVTPAEARALLTRLDAADALAQAERRLASARAGMKAAQDAHAELAKKAPPEALRTTLARIITAGGEVDEAQAAADVARKADDAAKGR